MIKEFYQKDWLIFIAELNNREINKQNYLGFNLWVLFGLFGFALFKILDSLPIIYADAINKFLFILFFTNIFNLYVILALLSLTFLIPQSGKRKIITELSYKASNLYSVIFKFIFFIGVIFNFYIAVNSKRYELSRIPYYIFCIYGPVCKIVFEEIFFIKDKTLKIDSGINYDIKNKKRIKCLYKIFMIVTFILFIIYSVYPIFHNNYILNHLDLMKSSIYLSLFIPFLILFSYLLNSNKRSEWLEQFEKRIILENISEEKIEEIFLNEFVGKDIIQWLKEIGNDIKEENDRIIKHLNEFKNEFNELKQEEKDLNEEIIKAKIILNTFTERMNPLKTKNKFSNITDKLMNFFKQGLMNEEEYLYFNSIAKDNKIMFNTFVEVNIMIDEVKTYIKDAEESMALKTK